MITLLEKGSSAQAQHLHIGLRYQFTRDVLVVFQGVLYQ